MMQSWVRRLCLTACLALFPLFAVEARTVRFEVKSQPLSQVIDIIADLAGIPVQKLGDVPGRLEKWSAHGEGIAVFQKLAQDANLFFAYDGTKAIVAASSEVKTTVLPLGNYDWVAAQNIIKTLYPIVPERTLRFDKATGMLTIRGPQLFNDTIAAVLAKPQNSTIKVIRGGALQEISPKSMR